MEKQRLIVLGDIHGNYEALRAVVEDAKRKYTIENDGKTISAISGFIFTGDYAGDFCQGEECISYIRSIAEEYPVYIVDGNRETGMLNKYYEAKLKGENINWSLDSTMASPLIDCNRISTDNLNFVYNLPNETIIDLPGESIFLTHRLPLKEETIQMLKEKNIKNVICGHTHVQHDPMHDEGDILIYNPGSVGFTEKGIPGADYGVLESNQNAKGGYTFDLNHIEYDYTKTINDLKQYPELFSRAKGWGYALEYSVLTGINCTALYMVEKNRISEFASKHTDKTPEEIIELYVAEYPNINFEVGRDGYVDIYNNTLTEGVVVAGEKDAILENMPYIHDKVSPASQEDWMYQLAFDRLNDFVTKYKANMEYISESTLVNKGR